MTDPYTQLGEQLAAAASRRSAIASAPAARSGRPTRRRIGAAAVALVLVGSAAGLAATGFLNGSPVRNEATVSPYAGNGLPVSGQNASRLALLVADPVESLPWGLRVLHTTRGQVCVQVGRVQDGQLGELGLDSAFSSDQRFHALPANVLPPGYGGGQSQTDCVGQGQTLVSEDEMADRSGARLLPEEFTLPGTPRKFPPKANLRALAYGTLGSHAVSITYRTPQGLHTAPVQAPDGAFLVVQPAERVNQMFAVGGSISGEATPHAVGTVVSPVFRPGEPPIVSAATFRFGSLLCSEGSGAPIRRPCPAVQRKPFPRGSLLPSRSLHQPVALKLLPQSRSVCSSAYLLYPCYKGLVTFRAPYAVRAAGADYDIDALQKCKIGGRPETAWSLERDVRAHELIQTVSLGVFVYTPACVPNESFRVSYVNPRGPSPLAPHESVIVGSVGMDRAGGSPRPPASR